MSSERIEVVNQIHCYKKNISNTKIEIIHIEFVMN